MKLSERLTIHAQDCALASRDNNDMVIGFHQMNDLAEALAEAAQLARRVEEAPVVEVGSYEGTCEVWIDGEHHITRTTCAEGIDPPDALAGQRVRLVRE